MAEFTIDSELYYPLKGGDNFITSLELTEEFYNTSGITKVSIPKAVSISTLDDNLSFSASDFYIDSVNFDYFTEIDSLELNESYFNTSGISISTVNINIIRTAANRTGSIFLPPNIII